MNKHSDSKSVQVGSVLLLEANRYNNRTNFRGSSFLASNIRVFGVRLFVKVDWIRWPDFGGREREIAVEYSFPILGRHTVRVAWGHDSYLESEAAA